MERRFRTPSVPPDLIALKGVNRRCEAPVAIAGAMARRAATEQGSG